MIALRDEMEDGLEKRKMEMWSICDVVTPMLVVTATAITVLIARSTHVPVQGGGADNRSVCTSSVVMVEEIPNSRWAKSCHMTQRASEYYRRLPDNMRHFEAIQSTNARLEKLQTAMLSGPPAANTLAKSLSQLSKVNFSFAVVLRHKGVPLNEYSANDLIRFDPGRGFAIVVTLVSKEREVEGIGVVEYEYNFRDLADRLQVEFEPLYDELRELKRPLTVPERLGLVRSLLDSLARDDELAIPTLEGVLERCPGAPLSSKNTERIQEALDVLHRNRARRAKARHRARNVRKRLIQNLLHPLDHDDTTEIPTVEQVLDRCPGVDLNPEDIHDVHNLLRVLHERRAHREWRARRVSLRRDRRRYHPIRVSTDTLD